MPVSDQRRIGLDQQLAQELAQWRAQHRYRQCYPHEAAQDTVLKVGGRDYLNFCSNDYLGLASDPRVVQAWQQAAATYGVGSSASHLICGHSIAHQRLEAALAEFVGRPRVLLFSTGYMANLGIASTLLNAQDCVFHDRYNHASLLDGVRLSGARFRRYPHADVTQLSLWLQKAKARRCLVMTDGVFSMDGDMAPLPALAEHCSAEQAILMVDDAHGFGVLGEQGRGILSHYQLGLDSVPVFMATLGKALGCFGAFVAGSDTLIEALIQHARSYLFTTALPPAMAETARAALHVMQYDESRREALRARITEFKRGAQDLALPILPSDTAIQPLLVGSTEQAAQMSAALWQRGIWVSAIRPPTVPEGAARLRITLSAKHRACDVAQLLDSLHQVLQLYQGDTALCE